MKQAKWCLLMAAFLFGGAGRSAADIITFDELPQQPVNGLTVKGVTFHYTEDGSPSNAAVFGGTGPGNLTYVQDPSLTGPSDGTLSFTFANPVTSFQFGLAVDSFSSLKDGASVTLSNGATQVGVFSQSLTPLITFAEGLFAYSGSPVNQAVVTFDSEDSQNFAFDNLQFSGAVETGPGGGIQNAPEPATLSLLGAGTIGLVLFRRRWTARLIG